MKATNSYHAVSLVQKPAYSIMRLLVRLKHWQLFLLLFGAQAILNLFLIAIPADSEQPAIALLFFPVILMFSAACYFAWLYSVGAVISRKMPVRQQKISNAFSYPS
jgi:hypothetical protein